MSSVARESDFDLLFALFSIEVQLYAVIRNFYPHTANVVLLDVTAFATPAFG
jgi:hypothetical protein